MTLNVGVVGVGAMGSMLVRAHSRFGSAQAFLLHAANRSPEPLAALASSVPDLCTGTPQAVAARSDLLFLCVPPGPYLGLAADLAASLPPAAVFVCISNGVALEDLAEAVAQPVVKLVPSLAHEVGCGVSLLIRGPRAMPEHLDLVRSFVASFSRVMQIQESDARIATNLTGCGPALFACFAELLAQSAAQFEVGLTVEELVAMSAESVAGAGALLHAGWTPAQLIEDVATPGGSTQAAVSVLRRELPTVLDAMHLATSARLAQFRKLPKK